MPVTITFKSTNLWYHWDFVEIWALVKQEKEEFLLLPQYFFFFLVGRRRLQSSSLLIPGALPMGWMLRSGTFEFSFKWHFPAFLAKPRMPMTVSATCSLPKSGLRETTGPIQPVRSGIQLRMSNSQVTGNCVNRNISGTCLILPGISGAELEY